MGFGAFIYGIYSRLPKLESRALKYGYSNARVRAMKGLLLKGSFLEELIRVGSIEGMTELLQRSGYKNDLAGASVGYSGSALIESAAARNFAKTVQKLVRITPKGDRKAISSLLMRWDLMNVKTIMHAKRLKKSYDETRAYLFEVGGLGEDDFRRLMKAEDNSILREMRRTEFGRKILASGSEEMRESFARAMAGVASFVKNESIIDSYVYLFMDQALSEAGGKEFDSIREILRKEIDARNIMIIERLKKHNTPRDRILSSLIKGGTMNERMVQKLMEAKDLNAVISIAGPKFRGLEFGEGKGLSELEIAFEKSIAAQKVHGFHRSILSAGVLIGFLLLKEEEINNLRKIAKGKEFRMSESEVRQMLVVV